MLVQEDFWGMRGETDDCELPQECPCGGRGAAVRSFSKEHGLGHINKLYLKRSGAYQCTEDRSIKSLGPPASSKENVPRQVCLHNAVPGFLAQMEAFPTPVVGPGRDPPKLALSVLKLLVCLPQTQSGAFSGSSVENDRLGVHLG